MKLRKSSLIVCLILSLTLPILVSGQYFIRDNAIPSYLYKEFDEIEENIFPRDLRINISMSRIEGTLLYSIDRNMNQLIISLYDSMSPSMTIEFNKQKHYVSLSKLCGCDRCRFTNLDLNIQITDAIHLRCNRGDFVFLQYDRRGELNDNYPNPFLKLKQNATEKNKARLWIVNTPRSADLYPNNAQLSGCIFDVSYKTQPVIFLSTTSNVDRKCNKTCTANVCNGGQCYETYNGRPVCNCTNTFNNGQYCNDNARQMNLKSISQYFLFDMFKMSWRSSTKSIMGLNNSKIEIRLYHQESDLLFELIYKNGYSALSKVILFNQYKENMEYIVIVQFFERNIDFKLFANGSWFHNSIPYNLDLRKQKFEMIILSCGTGYNDIVCKDSPYDYMWRKINIYKFVEFIETTPSKIDVTKHKESITPKNKTDESRKDNTIYIAVPICVILALIVQIPVIIFFLRSRKKQRFIKKIDASRKLIGRITPNIMTADATRCLTRNQTPLVDRSQMTTPAKSLCITPRNSFDGSFKFLVNETGSGY